MKFYSQTTIIVLLLQFAWTTSYHFAMDKMSFEAALSYCKAKQMELVKIKDKETDQHIYDWARRYNLGNYWINGNDKESEGVFVDSDKKRLTYTNWHLRQPDNYKNVEDCVHVYIDKNGFWNDLPCSDQLNVICEPMETTGYHFAKYLMSFESAISYCKGKQMELVKIKDKETDQLVYDWAKQLNFGDYWINGNDKEAEGFFVDSDKKRLNYTNWDPREPNNDGNAEHCVQVYMDKNGLWNDLPCNKRLNVICEPMEKTHYHFATKKMSFESAESYCKNKQMQLVKIENEEKNKIIFDWAKRHYLGHYWINGNDKESEGVFVDSDKQRLNYTNWQPKQPNNYKNSEHCIHAFIDKNGLWNDLQCDNLLTAICEPMESDTDECLTSLDYLGSLVKTLSEMTKSIIEKIKECLR